MSERLQSALAVALAKVQTGAAEEHPDGESLTAFRERRMSAGPRETVASHLARCSECRNVLSAVAQARGKRPKTVLLRRGGLLWIGAAAGLAVLFAAHTSTNDDGAMPRTWAVMREAAAKFNESLPARAPKVAYASAGVKPAGAPIEWRIRRAAGRAMLECSADAGKIWREAKLDGAFEPEAVGFNGMDVWVKSASGGVLLSRDGGLRWTPLKPVRRR